jgi:hypothetical protein
MNQETLNEVLRMTGTILTKMGTYMLTWFGSGDRVPASLQVQVLDNQSTLKPSKMIPGSAKISPETPKEAPMVAKMACFCILNPQNQAKMAAIIGA